MTTTPIGPPAPAIDQGAPGSPNSDGGGDVFLALVQGILDAQPHLTQPHLTQPSLAQPVAPELADATAGEAAPDSADPQADEQGVDPLSTILSTTPLLAGLAAALAPTVLAPAAGSEAGAPTPIDATAVTGMTGEPAPSGGTPLAGGATAGSRDLRPLPDRSDAAPGGATAGTTEDEPTAAPAPAGPTAATPATASATSSAPTSAPTSATPAPPVGSVAAPATPAPVGDPAPHGPVARQVFPEIVKLTTSTEGPQRVTIRLNPESLGEVRVVLTERRGTLEVSLSASGEARRALLDGTPELQRLLDAVGRGDSRIVVRDGSGLPVSAPASGAAPSGTSSGQAGAGTWSGDLTGGSGASAGRHGAEAGSDQGRRPMPGSTTATDGITAATSSRTTTETVTGARPGLDVTM